MSNLSEEEYKSQNANTRRWIQLSLQSGNVENLGTYIEDYAGGEIAMEGGLTPLHYAKFHQREDLYQTLLPYSDKERYQATKFLTQFCQLEGVELSLGEENGTRVSLTIHCKELVFYPTDGDSLVYMASREVRSRCYNFLVSTQGELNLVRAISASPRINLSISYPDKLVRLGRMYHIVYRRQAYRIHCFQVLDFLPDRAEEVFSGIYLLPSQEVLILRKDGRFDVGTFEQFEVRGALVSVQNTNDRLTYKIRLDSHVHQVSTDLHIYC